MFRFPNHGRPHGQFHQEKRVFFGPVVQIPNLDAQVEGVSLPYIGVSGGYVESFKGIPFAQPPVGALRLKPPQPLLGSLGRIDATTLFPASCPQFLLGEDVNIPTVPGIATEILENVVDTPLFKDSLVSGQEDCLKVNLQRPAGVKEGDNLPVLLWIFGGGFELGSTAMYDGSHIVANSMIMGKPVVFVAVNYRVGAFGFLGGKEVLSDGSANLGLLDQRIGMQWVADNIKAFGGNPDKVTLWGESAGAISIFSQLTMFDGDITYKGKPLFRGAIMNSGSAIPTDNVDCPKAQAIYDQVVEGAGCSGEPDTLACLRQADYQASPPYSSVALSYLPRPDGKVLTSSSEVLAASGKVVKVPFILGDQEDEGTLFSLFQGNITTTEDIEEYLSSLYFKNASPELISQLVAKYPEDPAAGSPFGSGDDNNFYPQYKRLAALLGDAAFTLTRRAVLNITSTVQPDVPKWSYLSSYDKGTPMLGTFHGSDLIQVFYGILPNFAAKATLNYYLNFAYNLGPNDNSGGAQEKVDEVDVVQWPRYQDGHMLININANDAQLIPDDFRQESYEVLLGNVVQFRF
ncbi:carboxylesterase [Pseudomassariella vexata]|uniref:Carboxylic ester hydrolase n=1 Tax=Pseudomassariella vexata TaxID=1141098 RepID=A0A1Y2E4Z4_9PEZI|nr:carboxylesterase [Pseudomassariella vexata]ORY66599.1 carboxylesterase [Pseudomassariella vexata]